jgi:AcrR family transcriptional regulator
MTIPRQGLLSETSGRVNQKRRTRTAIITAAQAILERGETPTVAQAAEEALVSRTTAYRYFPTQESLLLEVSLNVDVRDVEEFVADPPEAMSVEDRVLHCFDLFNGHVVADEGLHRTALRHFLDAWLVAERSGDQPPAVREGRRTRYLASLLGPVEDTIPEEQFKRLKAALCLTAGAEAVTVMRDVCRLDDDQEVLAVLHWAAEALLRTGLAPDSAETGKRRRTRRSSRVAGARSTRRAPPHHRPLPRHHVSARCPRRHPSTRTRIAAHAPITCSSTTRSENFPMSKKLVVSS